MTQHTPGPWRVIPDSLDIVGANPDHRRFIAEALEVEYEDGLLRVETEEATKANARLIAAAPELLAIVQKLVTLCPSSEGLGGHAPIQAFVMLGEQARKILVEKVEV